MTKAVELAQVASTGVSEAFKNRIINGAMVIDQRNAGASVTIPATGGQYTLDRWAAGASQASKYSVQQNAGSVTPPAGFRNYLGVTSLSAYSVGSGDLFYIFQPIEGFNTADLNFGTANAQTITVSFWVRSSLTGTFGGSLRNDAANRFYPFSYTISSANTWEQKSVTIAGDTTGTWVGATNGTGLIVYFGLGVGSNFSGTAGSWTGSSFYSATGATSVVGTNGATWYVTGVQLEVGSSATSFEYRSYGQELLLCQRYYQAWYPAEQELIYNEQSGAGNKFWQLYMPVPMRTAPTATYSAGMIGGAVVGLSGTISSLSLTSASINRVSTRVTMSTSSGSGNLMYHCDTIGGGDFVGLSAEL